MAEGYIKLYRQIWENEYLWEDKPFSRGQAWIDLLLMANHETKYVISHKMSVERGQRILSVRQLSERWGWSNTKIVNFLNSLKSANMIDFKSDTKKTVITIVNYSFFQDKEKPKRHRNDTEATPKRTNKNEKNDKEYISCSESPKGESYDREKFKEISQKAAEYMAKKILAHTPTYLHLKPEKRKATIDRWAEDIEKLLRIDGVDVDEFRQVLQFCMNDSFWQSNVLSGQKLREQYPQLLVKMRGKLNDE